MYAKKNITKTNKRVGITYRFMTQQTNDIMNVSIPLTKLELRTLARHYHDVLRLRNKTKLFISKWHRTFSQSFPVFL